MLTLQDTMESRKNQIASLIFQHILQSQDPCFSWQNLSIDLSTSCTIYTITGLNWIFFRVLISSVYFVIIKTYGRRTYKYQFFYPEALMERARTYSIFRDNSGGIADQLLQQHQILPDQPV